ncbi:PD40 domain-containing protein [candidate division KSB1 bacterium]|nr:PD40 domain-containing protein [candidate division KSB1 bacterium]
MLLVIMVIALSCSEKPMEPSQTEPSPETQFALEKGNIAVPLIAFATEYHSTWSPNGKKIAFQTDRDGNYEIYSMNADGSHQTNLTNSPASSDYDPDWAKVVLK